MSNYSDGRIRRSRIGISSYTEEELSLDVIGYTNVVGKIGIGSVPTTNSPELYVDGNAYLTGIITASRFFAGPTEITGGATVTSGIITASGLNITGVATVATLDVNQLSPDLVTLVIVPVQADQSFGSLFEIKSESDEIFISGATVDNIEIIDSVTATKLKATGSVITSAASENSGVLSSSLQSSSNIGGISY